MYHRPRPGFQCFDLLSDIEAVVVAHLDLHWHFSRAAIPHVVRESGKEDHGTAETASTIKEQALVTP